jgi:hypothetical protein
VKHTIINKGEQNNDNVDDGNDDDDVEKFGCIVDTH